MLDKHTQAGRPNEDEDEAGTVEAAVISAPAAGSPTTGRPHISSSATTVDEKDIGLKTANPPQSRIPLRSVSTVAKIIIIQTTVPMTQ